MQIHGEEGTERRAGKKRRARGEAAGRGRHGGSEKPGASGRATASREDGRAGQRVGARTISEGGPGAGLKRRLLVHGALLLPHNLAQLLPFLWGKMVPSDQCLRTCRKAGK
jgi:hypothetical protein